MPRLVYDPGEAIGICPACGEPCAWDDPDGPVWTCPADLAPTNRFAEPPLPPFDTMTEAEREKIGYFGNCREDTGDAHGQCYEPLPLHSACYEKGGY